jgi:hypothetical protein
VRVEVEAAGVALGTCEKAGHAIVGTGECDTCAEERSVHEVKRRDASRPPPQERIWAPGAADAPIAPLPRHDTGLKPEDVEATAARVREAMSRAQAVAPSPATPAPTTPADTRAPPAAPPRATCACGCGREIRSGNRSGYAGSCGRSQSALALARRAANEQQTTQEPPAPTPAEEEDAMPTGVRAAPCPGCGTKGSKHRQVNGKDCPQRGTGRGAAPETPPARGDRPARKVVVLRRPGAPAQPPDVDALLARREDLVKEGKRIEAEIGQVNADLLTALAREEQRVEKLRTAVHEAAQRAAGAG